MESQSFSAGLSRTKRLIYTVAGIAAILGIMIGCASLMGGESSSDPRSSQGKAEIACERAIENQVGTKPRAEYTSIDENGTGDFTLYGHVKADYATAKFICNVTGATTKGDASAEVSIFD